MTDLAKTNTLHRSAYRGNIPKLRSVLETHPEFCNTKDFNGATPLHHAAYKGHYEVVMYLLQRGALPDAQDKDLCTPLHNACFTGEARCALAMIERGANVNHRDIDGATPLHKAAFNGKLEVCKVLVGAGADVNFADIEDVTAVHKASYNDHPHVLTFLISQGADIQSHDNKGQTALHKAAFNGNVHCAQILLENGIDPNAVDVENTTPLHNAVYNGHTDVVEVLLMHGADPNQCTSKYKSYPLHFAAFNGYVDCMRLLVEREAYINVQDLKGLTPLLYAVKREHEDCVEYLLERGADVEIVDTKQRGWKDMTSSPHIIALFHPNSKRRPSVSRFKSNSFAESPRKGASQVELVKKSASKEETITPAKPSSPLPVKNLTHYQPPHSTNSALIEDENKELEIYKHLDIHGFFTPEDPGPTDPNSNSKDFNRAIKWTKLLGEGVDKWEKMMQKSSNKIKTKCEKGIPARVRGQAWKLLAKSAAEQLPARNVVKYEDLLKLDSDHVPQINRDINRTFPKSILLMHKDGQEALFNVLKANSIYNKETGYCQGMGFVAALLLMYMEEEDAFWVLSQLCNVYGLSEVWRPGLPGLPKCFFTIDKLFQENVPKVHQRMKEAGVPPSLFSTEWFLTVFLYNLPFPIALRIWDVFLFEGFHFIYAIGLAIVKLYSDKIAVMEFEELFQFLKFNNFKKGDLDVDELMKKANSYKEIVKRSLKTIDKDYEKFKASKEKKN